LNFSSVDLVPFGFFLLFLGDCFIQILYHKVHIMHGINLADKVDLVVTDCLQMANHQFLQAQRLFLFCQCIVAQFLLQKEINCVWLLRWQLLIGGVGGVGLGSRFQQHVNGPASPSARVAHRGKETMLQTRLKQCHVELSE